MKKTNKNDTINLFFSAFLVIAFIVCAHFFSKFMMQLSSTAGAVVSVLLYAVFGLLLFYATRVGEGKVVFRFSVMPLIFMVAVPIFIVIASFASGMPFHDAFAASDTGSLSMIVILSGVSIGYGIPYSFISGFELAEEKSDVADNGEPAEILEGGVEADILESMETESLAETEEIAACENEDFAEAEEKTSSDDENSDNSEESNDNEPSAEHLEE